jgi:hypothetical protein
LGINQIYNKVILNQSYPRLYKIKYFRLKYKATFASAIITDTSTNGPITAVNAYPEFIPNIAILTAISSSKLLHRIGRDS